MSPDEKIGLVSTLCLLGIALGGVAAWAVLAVGRLRRRLDRALEGPLPRSQERTVLLETHDGALERGEVEAAGDLLVARVHVPTLGMSMSSSRVAYVVLNPDGTTSGSKLHFAWRPYQGWEKPAAPPAAGPTGVERLVDALV